MARRCGNARATWVAATVMASLAGCDGNAFEPRPSGDLDYNLTIGVTNEVGAIASLAAEIVYDDVTGEFGSSDGSPCQITTPGAFGVVTQNGDRGVRIAVASFLGFDTPSSLATCRFEAWETVQKTEFRVELIEVLAPDGEPPGRAPSIEVTEIALRPTATTTTTLGD